MENNSSKNLRFSGYQKLVIAILAFLQFTVILDFMILAPLGAILMPALQITTAQFGIVVSAYAFSAGAAGILSAGFADRYDRKKLLLFFYVGFLLGTLCCGLAPTYETLLVARMITGLFGGVIGSIVFAITTDLFPMQVRGRVMGIVQTAFAASQVLGLPTGLYLSTHFGWHAAFLMIVGVGGLVGVLIAFYLKPLRDHLKHHVDRHPLLHLFETVSKPKYLHAFATTALLSTGGFMLMPFGSAFYVNNLKITLEQLPLIYVITGGFNLLMGPLIGRLSDSIGKLKMFTLGSLLGIALVLYYTQLQSASFGLATGISVVMFTAIGARMISASALISAVPEPAHRGSFMSVSSSLQQMAGGVASSLAGLIVIKTPEGPLERFNILGYVVVGAMLITIFMMHSINPYIEKRKAA